MQSRDEGHGRSEARGAARARTAGATTARPVALLLRLQRQAGNRAVAGAMAVQRVAVIGPAPTQIPQGEPLPGATADRSNQPLGDTRPTASTTPQWHIQGTTTNGRWEGRLQPTTAGEVQIAARYPAPDAVYPIAQGSSTRPRLALVPADVSELVRDGEQEHSNDFHLAHHNVYDVVATTINTLAAGPAKCGPNVADVHRQYREALRAALPAPLQAPVEDISPTAPWSNTVARLNGLSNERDANHWHDMGSGFATQADRDAHGVAPSQELIRILPGGQIGQHDSQARIDAAVPGLRPTTASAAEANAREPTPATADAPSTA